MTLEKIYKLLRSRTHEDRALGVEFLEQIPDYKSMFKANMWDTYTGILFGKEGLQDGHTTHIITKNEEYWVTKSYLLIYEGEKPSKWGPAIKTIRI